MQRKIIHVDMDAFYASVEQRDAPNLRGRPVAVGGTSRRGVVMTASYEARRFGVHSAMASGRAVRLCPELIIVPPRFEAYREVSRQIREIFLSFSPLVEPLSLDEAYIDATETLKGPPSATLVAAEIKREIFDKTGLTSSAGVSYCKFLAKTASGMNKPDGLTVILPEQALAFLAELPIEDFHGVGPATAARMKNHGIHYGRDLQERGEVELVALFGKAGRYFHRIALGLDEREVHTSHSRKSVGGEETFEEDLIEEAPLLKELGRVCRKVGDRLERAGSVGRTVTLKIKYHDFTVTTRSRTLQHDVRTGNDLLAVGADLLRQPSLPGRPVRLIGISVSNLRGPDGCDLSPQLDLGFGAEEDGG